MMSQYQLYFQEALKEAGAEDYLYWLYMLAERQIEILIESSLPMPGPTVTTTAEAIHWIRGLHNYDIIRVRFIL